VKIGELARRAGITPDAIRFYEREGLLPPPARTDSGYRDFGEGAVEDLDFIRKGQALGLRLSEIREVMDLTADGHAPCDHVRASVTARLDDVERRMSELRTLRTTLKEALARLDEGDAQAPGCRCGVIDR
jgi:DNA-binding transcriptional MerR regulator